jgi:glucosyl-3-phosphoglycerate phosphatase
VSSIPIAAENALFLVLRHAETETNAKGAWHGGQDDSLAASAIRAVEAASVRLVGIVNSRHVRIISSDLKRAAETAEIMRVAVRADIVVYEPLLRERDMGQWAGKSPAEVERTWPGALGAWEAGLSDGPPGGETDEDVAARALASLRRHAVREEAITIVVTHAGVIRSVSYVLTGQKPPVPHLAGYWMSKKSNDDFVMGTPVILGDPSAIPRT